MFNLIFLLLKDGILRILIDYISKAGSVLFLDVVGFIIAAKSIS